VTGQELYRRWAEAMADEGVIVDDWDCLGLTEQYAWTNLAEQMSPIA
jgi:hypothetical protein